MSNHSSYKSRHSCNGFQEKDSVDPDIFADILSLPWKNSFISTHNIKSKSQSVNKIIGTFVTKSGSFLESNRYIFDLFFCPDRMREGVFSSWINGLIGWFLCFLYFEMHLGVIVNHFLGEFGGVIDFLGLFK